jgi:TRAP-type C4-dicarboxylate transport system substrate-binding protein
MSRNKISRRNFVKTSAVAATAALSAPSLILPGRAPSADHVLTFGHTFGKATEDVMITGLELFKQKAEEYADGKLLVDIHEAGSLGGQNELPQKVLTGSIQGCQLSTQNFTPFSDVYNLLDLPYLFPGNDAFEDMLASEEFLESEFTTQPLGKGLMVLPGMWANAGFRVLGIGKKAERTIQTPQDLDGIKIRVTGSKVEQQIFNMTPASPVSIAWAETYQAMQQGVADALNVGLGPLTATKIYETLGSATLSQINFNCHVTVISARWFDTLPSGVQDAVLTAAAESYAFQRTGQADANRRMIEMWEASGITIIEPSAAEKQIWSEAVGHQRPEWDSLKEQYGADVYEKLVGWIS